ncbi:MAG TPA: caspase family protein, partial [Xanthobacteraceae bacterium]|nr:caspase family protein [Xanthobacteraceae bacterium]
DTILAGLDDQVRTNILILDACRNNPVASQVASAGPSRTIEPGSGLAAPAALGSGATLGAGTLIAFATAPGQVALDGEGINSPFSAALSRHIGTPGLEVQQMLTRVRAEVVAATKARQVPWSNSSLLGEVYLAAK